MNAVVPKNDTLPAHLGTGKTKKFSNADNSDLIIPRIKLLQPLNPEVEAFEEAKAGIFWHTMMSENWGNQVLVVPIRMRKSYVLWAPRGDSRGILARANDAIHWDPPKGEFEVKFDKDPNTYIWTLAPTVAASRLDQFGTQRPGDDKSVPAAALTYEWLFYFPEHGSCALVITSRGAVKKGQKLYSMIENKPRDAWLQQYSMEVRKEAGANGSTYHNYEFVSAGYVDAETAEITAALEERYSAVDYKANDETEETIEPDKETPAPKAERNAKSKY